MILAPVCLAGDVCPSPANPPSSRLPVLLARTRAAVRYALETLHVRATREEVDDLMQDTLMRLWERYPEAWGRYPRRLVNHVALRIAIDNLRCAGAKKRDARKTVSLEDAGDVSLHTVPEDDAAIAREELNEKLRFCRRVLPAEHWRAFLALFVFGLTSREAALLFGCPPSTLDSRSLRLRRALAERGITLQRRWKGSVL